MKTGYLRKLIILVMLIVLASTFGCSAGKDVYEVSSLAADSFSSLILPDKKPILKKKILIAPVINKAGISDAQAEEIKQDCISHLSRDKFLHITTLKKFDDNESVFLLKNYGPVINPEYVKTAEEKGMNIFFAYVIHPIDVTEKRTGIWPLRKDSYNVVISVSVHAIDTVNNTLICYEDKKTDINFDKSDVGENDNWTPDYSLFKNEISSMTKKLCSSVIEKLRKQPWQTKVHVEDGNIVLKAGRDIGINENTAFELYKKGDPVEAYYNAVYYTFGDKIGESVPKSVSEDRTVLAANIDLKDAFYIRVKRSDD